MADDGRRHIGYGTWYLQTAVPADITLGDEVRQTVRDLLRAVAASLAPPDRGDDTDWDAAGASANEVRAFALDGLNRRLQIIGVELASAAAAGTAGTAGSPCAMSGGEGDDTLDGGRGPHRLGGRPGADHFFGGPGKDRASDSSPAEGDSQGGTVP